MLPQGSTNKDLISDKRSDRKSSVMQRCCKNHGTGCDFVGSRAEMIEHEANCEHLPPETLREKVGVLTNELANARREIATLVSTNSLEVARRKSEVTATAWQTNKEVLRKVNGLGVVEMFRKTAVEAPEVYTLSFVCAEIYYNLIITAANFNVSAMLYCRDVPVKETHNRTNTVVLIHPDGPQLNKVTKISVTFTKGESKGHGNGNWMTSTEFRSFFKDDTFAIGV